MITDDTMGLLINSLQDAYSDVVVSCSDHLEHTIPIDVFRDNVRVSLGKDRFDKEKTDGDFPQVSRIIVDTRTISKRYRRFLDGMIDATDGNQYEGSYRHVSMAVSFLATDWYDLFGKRIAWKMALDVEALLMNSKHGIWDPIFQDAGAILLRKDYDVLADGMKSNWGIENIYLVTLAFQLTDVRIIVVPGQDVDGDAPIENIEFEVEMI